MTQKTALSELIEDINLIIEATQASPRFNDSVKAVSIAALKTLRDKTIIPKLPKERQDLIDAYDNGYVDSSFDGDNKSEQYVHEKFGI